jgi:hypothetical protein
MAAAAKVWSLSALIVPRLDELVPVAISDSPQTGFVQQLALMTTFRHAAEDVHEFVTRCAGHWKSNLLWLGRFVPEGVLSLPPAFPVGKFPAGAPPWSAPLSVSPAVETVLQAVKERPQP